MKKIILVFLLMFFSLDSTAQRIHNDDIEQQVIRLIQLFQSNDSLGFFKEFAPKESKIYELGYEDDEDYRNTLKSDKVEHSQQIAEFHKFRLKKYWNELSDIYYNDGIVWQDVSIDSILLFENFYFEDLKKYDIENYKVYIFCTDVKSGKKWVTEGAVRFYMQNDLYDFCIYAVHQANDLIEYIKVRGEKSMGESHPEGVNKYLGWE